MFSESAIGQHFLDNSICAKNYSNGKFAILSFGRLSFYLSALEAVNINHASQIYADKKFFYNLILLR